MRATAGRPDRPLAAILVVCAAACLASGQDALIKHVSGDYPFHEMQMIRCLTALPVCIGFLLWTEGRGGLRALAVPRWRELSLRGLLLAIASMLFYLTAAAMPFPEAIALYFSMPLWIAALSGPLLGERVRWHQWAAVVAGFAGVLILLRPGSAIFEPAALIGLLSALLAGLGQILTRRLGPIAGSGVQAVYQDLYYLLVAGLLTGLFGAGGLQSDVHVSLAYLTRPWVTPTWQELVLIGGLGLTTGALMIMYTAAYRLADASLVAPFEYTTILWATLFSYMLWGTVLGTAALTGIGLIVGAGLFMLAADRYIVDKGRRRVTEAGTEQPGQLALPDPDRRG